MNITILTQYYPAETGAPQNRLSDLALQLKNAGHEITVLTAMPNYPQNEIHDNYKGKYFISESINEIVILRSWIYVGKSRSVIPRLFNYFSFVISSFIWGILKLKKQDVIICESPPLFLGITGWLLSVFKKSKFVFNISDLWPESAEKLGVITNKTLLKMAERLELFLYKKSFLITGQTQGIVQNIKERTQLNNLHWMPNGISEETLQLNFNKSDCRKVFHLPESAFVLSYAGVIGHAQGLEVILNAATELQQKDIIFVICGDGPELNNLKTLAHSLQLNNIVFTGPVRKTDALQLVAASDAAIIPLKKIDLFKGAIPSKIFENCAMSKPILLGVDGEAKELFINEAQAGIYFEPENATELSSAIEKLFENKMLCATLGQNGKQFVLNKFSRKQIANNFLKILEQKLNNSTTRN
ncbi:MAG TPA: glycosyltransferase family 4 protein [Bacteroidia bacterium]|nr:glycosyltransferase family 4 protein [Bacteroidia bacterium]